MARTISRRAAAAVGFVLLALVFLTPQAGAQYFGRNKVQYQPFDFKVMKTRHFDVYFYLQDEEVVKQAAIMAERWYQRLARIFNHELKGRQPLILYSSGPQFQQTTVIPGELGEGTGGVTESFKRRIVLPYGATLGETDHVIGHELVHAFQYDIMSQGHSDNARGGAEAGLRVPLWFIEGMAEYLSIGPVDPTTTMWMRDATRRKKLPAIEKMDNTYKYFPYRYGHALWAYLTGRYGDEIIGKMMKTVGRAGSYEPVLESLTGVKLKQLSADWHKAMEDAYLPLVEKTKNPADYGKALVKGSEQNPYNISPVVSPDGKESVFFSSRDLFSIDLFLADAATGKIQRKLISTAVDPHFESLQFIRSAGSWDGKGERFVFGAVSKGRPNLTIVNIAKDKVEREIAFNELDEILNPSWSPDSRWIAFSALAGGVSDIFIYDLEQNVLKQLTRDSYSDLHPAWSPDGKRLAFATDRFSTNLQWMDIGESELALLDPETGRIEKLLGFPTGKNVSPQWSPDGRSLYFLSDQNGKTDLYRLELGSGRIFEVTNLFGGISGITELSPAMTVAQQSGRILYSAYEEGHHSIYAIDAAENLQGEAFLAQFPGLNLAVLPPRKAPEGALLGLLKNPLFGLPKETNFPVSAYKPKLTLDYVAPPTLAVGVDRYGTYGGGGIAAYWSDMLGYHTIVTGASTGNRLIDSSALLAYQNTRHRMNWGAVMQRVPYIVGAYYNYYFDDTGRIAGEPAWIEQERLIRQINWEAAAFAYYPFNQVRRFEMNAGARYIQFNDTLYTRAYSYFTEMLIMNDKESLEVPKGLALGYLTGSLVYDSGIFGATSPILGQSYILQVQPTFGSINYASVLADYRKYIMPVRPFTLAFRALHYGRYGKGGEDTRLWPIYLGYWDLVRGYESFTQDEYQDGGDFNLDRLYGSKMFLANFEIRFPLLRVLGLGKGFYGAWPIEFYGFYDIGLAWWDGYDANSYYLTTTDDPRPWFISGGTRKPISSVGAGLRTNVFGFLIIGVHYVYPFDRPQRGWHLQLSISPGF